MTPLLWSAAVVALVAAVVAALARRPGRLARALGAAGVVGMVAGGLAWGAWLSSNDVTATVVRMADGGCTVRWIDRVRKDVRTARVDCEPGASLEEDVRVKAHVGPLTGRATAHVGPVRRLALYGVPGIGTVLALVGLALAPRR